MARMIMPTPLNGRVNWHYHKFLDALRERHVSYFIVLAVLSTAVASATMFGTLSTSWELVGTKQHISLGLYRTCVRMPDGVVNCWAAAADHRMKHITTRLTLAELTKMKNEPLTLATNAMPVASGLAILAVISSIIGVLFKSQHSQIALINFVLLASTGAISITSSSLFMDFVNAQALEIGKSIKRPEFLDRMEESFWGNVAIWLFGAKPDIAVIRLRRVAQDVIGYRLGEAPWVLLWAGVSSLCFSLYSLWVFTRTRRLPPRLEYRDPRHSQQF